MRRKRLQHAADNLCQMFCGWRQISSKPQLVELGSGLLEIDTLTGDSRFNGAAIAPLTIAAELRAWLEQDLEAHGIPKATITEATVRAELSFDLIPWDKRTTKSEFFWHRGEPARSDPMNRCTMRCTSLVRTAEAEYRGEYQDVEEWPVGWPAA